MDIEAGLKQEIIPHDETTVFIVIDEISYQQRPHTQKKKRKYAPAAPAAALHRTSAAHRPQKPTPAASHPVPLATDFTINDMIRHNIETLQFYMTTLMTTEDYMKFIFANKDIEARFHRYINNILVHKTEGRNYLQLEEHINNRRILMDKVSQLPQNGQTFMLADFDKDMFVVPCSKDEYMKKYCQENDFCLPPGRELLTQPPTHPGLYKRTMTGLKQIDRNCRTDTTHKQIAFGQGKRIH